MSKRFGQYGIDLVSAFLLSWVLLPAVAVAQTAPSTPPFRYTLRLLGSLGSGWSKAMDINNLGEVVGNSATSTGDPRGFIVFAGAVAMTDVNTLIEPSEVYPNNPSGWRIRQVGAINDRRLMLGYARRFNDGQNLRNALVLLTPKVETGTWTVTEIYPSINYGLSTANHVDMNEFGDVVGLHSTARSFIWTAENGIRDLGTLGTRTSYVQGLSDRSLSGDITVVGKTFGSGNETGWITTMSVTSGSVATIQSLSGTNLTTNAVTIISNGDIFGNATIGRYTPASRYRGGKWTSLGSLNTDKGGSQNGIADDANNLGYVVGLSSAPRASGVSQLPFLYHDSFKMVSLDSLVIGLPSNLRGALDPTRINESNSICGTANNGVNQAYLLTPTAP